MQLKRKIKHRFNGASNSYDKVACVQKQSAELLVQKLQEFDKLFYPQTILDLGTGTGYIPEILLPHLSSPENHDFAIYVKELK